MIKPLEPYILISPEEQETKLKSGIFIPETSKERPQMGKVVASYEGSDLEAEDMVCYKKWGGHEVKVDGKEMILIDVDDILAMVGEENE